jgi:SAM-dependent methyltransferase
VEGFAEDLSAQFPANHFDAVYCSNALDHSMDPMRGIEEMLIVAKIGGNVTLQHNANEALFENYAGFHQWNFDAENGAFVIWNREKRYVVNEWVAAHATIEARRFGEGLSVVMRKTSDLPVDLEDRHRLRVRTLLAAFTLASGSSWTPPTA